MQMYTIEDVARIMCVSKDAVRDWIAGGKLKVMKVNARVYRIREEDLAEFYFAGTSKPSNQNYA